MLISKAKFKLAAVEFTAEFMQFAHFYGIYENALRKKTCYENGMRTFSTAELADPKNELQEQYEKAVKAAIDKLFCLDRKFYAKYKEHINVFLENFNDYQNALSEVTDFIYEERGYKAV